MFFCVSTWTFGLGIDPFPPPFSASRMLQNVFEEQSVLADVCLPVCPPLNQCVKGGAKIGPVASVSQKRCRTFHKVERRHV